MKNLIVNTLILLLMITSLVACSNISKEVSSSQERSPSSALENCSEIVGKILSIKGLASGQLTEVEAKTRALAIIKKRYPHFDQFQAQKHFDLLKTSCL